MSWSNCPELCALFITLWAKLKTTAPPASWIDTTIVTFLSCFQFKTQPYIRNMTTTNKLWSYSQLLSIQITALSEIWPQAINSRSRQHAASLMSDVIPVDEIWLCCQICDNLKFWNPGLKNMALEFTHR